MHGLNEIGGMNMDNDMDNKIKKLVLNGYFDQAKIIFNSYDSNYIRKLLLKLCYETENIIIYTFLNSMLFDKEKAELHYLAAELLSMPLCHINGAYESALFHARKAIELDPDDISYKEYILFFHRLPNTIISDEEVITFATEVLSEIPDSKVALDILNDMKKNKDIKR